MNIEAFIEARLRETLEMAEQTMDIDSDLGNRIERQCQVLMDIVEMHESWPVLVQSPVEFDVKPGDVDSYIMYAQQKIQWLTEKEYYKKFGEQPPTAPLVNRIAAIFSWHPDYDPAWAISQD